MRGCLTAQSQPEDKEEAERNPSVLQQELQPDTTEGEDIAKYDLDVDYQQSEPKNEAVAQEKKEENSHAEYAKMEIS